MNNKKSKIVVWDKRHAKILSSVLLHFNNNNIKNFIIRNYEGLPNHNKSKDVDFIIEPGKIDLSLEILKKIFTENQLDYFYSVSFENGNLCYGMSVKSNTAIHIDLMEGYFSKGSELFSFDKLYQQTEFYNGFKVLNRLYTGLMVFIYKQFGHKKPQLKEEYRDIIFQTYNDYPEFKILLNELIGDYLSKIICQKIKQKKFDEMLIYSDKLTRQLTNYSFRKNFLKTFKGRLRFYFQKVYRILFQSKKNSMVISVIAINNQSKNIFINKLIDKLKFYYVEGDSNSRFTIYNFRPQLINNLKFFGVESKKSSSFLLDFLISFLKLNFYFLDYIFGYNINIRRDVQFDKFSIFNGYIYDVLADKKFKNIAFYIKKFFVMITPKPKITFFIYESLQQLNEKKHEFESCEFNKINSVYEELAKRDKRIVKLNFSNINDDEVDKAVVHVLDQFALKI